MSTEPASPASGYCDDRHPPLRYWTSDEGGHGCCPACVKAGEVQLHTQNAIADALRSEADACEARAHKRGSGWSDKAIDLRSWADRIEAGEFGK